MCEREHTDGSGTAQASADPQQDQADGPNERQEDPESGGQATLAGASTEALGASKYLMAVDFFDW